MKEYKSIRVHKPEDGGVVWARKVARPRLSDVWRTAVAWVTGNHIEILVAVTYGSSYPNEVPKVATMFCRALPYVSGKTVVTKTNDRKNIQTVN